MPWTVSRECQPLCRSQSKLIPPGAGLPGADLPGRPQPPHVEQGGPAWSRLAWQTPSVEQGVHTAPLPVLALGCNAKLGNHRRCRIGEPSRLLNDGPNNNTTFETCAYTQMQASTGTEPAKPASVKTDADSVSPTMAMARKGGWPPPHVHYGSVSFVRAFSALPVQRGIRTPCHPHAPSICIRT